MDFLWCGFLSIIIASSYPITWGPRFPFLIPLALGALLSRFSLINPRIPLSFKRDLLLLLIFSICCFLIGYYWIPHTLKVFNQIEFPWYWAIGSLFIFAAFPHFFAALIIFHLLKKYRRIWPIPMQFRQVLLAFIMTMFEQYIPQEFPAHLGHPFIIYAPYLKLVPYFGAPLISFMVFLAAFIICDFLIYRKVKILNSLFVIILIALNIFLPQKDPSSFNSHQLRIVQGNIGNFEKLESEKARESGREPFQYIFETYKRLSTKDIRRPIDLIIWPETSVPTTFDSSNFTSHPIFSEIARETNAEIIFGGYDEPSPIKGNYQTAYNSLIHLDNQAKLKKIYHKIHLFPFGEDLPLGPLTKYVWEFFPSIPFFGKGDSFQMFYTNKGIPFTSVICYEILHSSFMRTHILELPKYPHFIVNITNDSWYGDTSEPLHHLELSLWRGLEFQIPVIRSTNTGISTIINSDGTTIKEKIPLFKEAVIDFELKTPVDTQPTLYLKYGNIPLFFLVLSYSAFLFFIFKRKETPLPDLNYS